MKVSRMLIAGVVIMVFNTVVAMLTCGWLFRGFYDIEPTSVWKSMDAPPGPAYYVGAIVLSIILAFIYALLQKGIPGRNRFVKGLVFGLCVWAVGMLPGMFATYMFMTVAPTVVIYWAVMGLIQSPLQGLIIAAIYGE